MKEILMELIEVLAMYEGNTECGTEFVRVGAVDGCSGCDDYERCLVSYEKRAKFKEFDARLKELE